MQSECANLSSVACPALQIVSRYITSGRNFRENVERKIRVQILPTNFVCNISHP